MEITWENLGKLENEIRSEQGPGQINAEFNEEFIKQFRATKGKMSGEFKDITCLLLTIRGRKTGKERVYPLGYVKTEGRLFVVASRSGAAKHPMWYLNLLANPDVKVEIDDQTYQADTVTLAGRERDRIFEAIKAALPKFGEYQTRTTRQIPVVELVRRG